jgi:hypothetical protein
MEILVAKGSRFWGSTIETSLVKAGQKLTGTAAGRQASLGGSITGKAGTEACTSEGAA